MIKFTNNSAKVAGFKYLVYILTNILNSSSLYLIKKTKSAKKIISEYK